MLLAKTKGMHRFCPKGSGDLCMCNRCMGASSSDNDGALTSCSYIDMEVGCCSGDNHDSMLDLPSSSSMVEGAQFEGGV